MKRNYLPYAFLVFFVTTCLTSKAVSMGEIMGQVIEKESLKPVAFALVIFENNMDKVTVTANEYGLFDAPHLPTGKYQMRVAFNNRTFVMNKIRVYDDCASEINFVVSKNEKLPVTVEVVKPDQVFNPLGANNRIYASNSANEPTRDFSEVLDMTPGVDVRNGKIYVKGSDQVHFFIDGSPVMAPPASVAR